MASSSWALESPARSLFRRCVQCPQGSPVCPTCPQGQVCSLITETCSHCASMICVDSSEVGTATASPSSVPSSSSSANSGAIAGAVIGGIVVIALVTYLVWRFCIKNKRKQTEAAWQNYNMGSEKDFNQPVPRPRDPRASTHTRSSVASSVLTRASNIIQIAYIPGVTNRSAQSSTDLVPPVPPIPAASNASSPHTDSDDHYFRPDIRASTYSAVTDRNSIASTVYRSHAIVSPVPAQMASRAKPTAVSVRSNRPSPSMSRSTTPPVPMVPTVQALNTKSSIVGRVGQPKPVQILRKKPSGGEQPRHIYELDGSGSEASASRQNSVTSPLYNSTSMGEDASDVDDDTAAAASRRLIQNSNRKSSSVLPAELAAYPSRGNAHHDDVEEDDSEETGRWDNRRTKRAQSLNQIIEEATLHASKDYAPHDARSPFDDAHAAHTP